MVFCNRWDQEVEKVFKTSRINLNSLCPPLEIPAKQEFIIDRHRPGFVLLRKGFAKISRIKKDQEYALRIAKPDSLIGYGFWYLSTDDSYKLTMLTEGCVSFYEKKSFDKIHSFSRMLDELIAESLSLSLFLKDDRIAALENISSSERVIAVLSSLANEIGVKTDEGKLISLDIGRATMAQMAGTTVVNFSRVLTGLEKKKIILRSGKTGIIIPEISPLNTPSNKKQKA